MYFTPSSDAENRRAQYRGHKAAKVCETEAAEELRHKKVVFPRERFPQYQPMAPAMPT